MFKLNDIVVMKGGKDKTKMTIYDIDGDWIYCVWFVGSVIHRARIPENYLIVFEEEKKTFRFGVALLNMRQNTLKISRKAWDKDFYIFIGIDGKIWLRLLGDACILWRPEQEDILAKDWFIYGEKK